MTASRMRACACDTASRLCVRTVLCRSAFSLAPPLRSTGSAAAEAGLFARFRATMGRSDFSIALIVGYGLRPSRQRPDQRLAGTAMEISRFPCIRLLGMPGSTTTRGQHVSCDIDTGCVAFCWTENISAPNLSYAAQYLACALPCERFTSTLAGSPCITRGRCGSLLLHRDGLPPSTSCRSHGAPVLAVVPSIGWRTGQSATQKRPSVRAKRVANPPSSISPPKDAADAPPGACGRNLSESTSRRLLAREVVRCVDRLGPAMPADNANGARLRALYPFLFGESDLGADL